MAATLACALAACAAPQHAPSPLSDATRATSAQGGGWRSEPVIYNGRRYAVSFRNAGANARQVRVAAPGRRLGATRGDGRIVSQIASSTVAHFTCRSGKARLRPGSLKPRDGRWHMLVDCL